MSWLKENYEKAALGGAAVIALSVGALILTSDAGEKTAAQDPKRVNEYEVAELKSLVAYSEVLANTAKPSYQNHKDADLTSFIAFPMYGIKGNNEGPQEIEATTLFDGIPMAWWRQSGLDDYRFTGAASNDIDEDGFSHAEEYKAGTNPVDVASHPDLLHKMKLIGSKAILYRIQGSYVDGDRVSFNFRYKRTSDDFCHVGDTFPTKDQPEQFLNRFKFKAKGRAENPSTNFVEDFYEVEDTKKAGKVYKLWSSDAPVRLRDFIGKFKLETPNGGASFTVPEGGEFSLPFKKGGKGYKFLIDGKRDLKQRELKSVKIQKAGGKPVKPIDTSDTSPREKPDVISLDIDKSADDAEN